MVAENHFLVELYRDADNNVVVVCSLGHSYRHPDVKQVARWVVEHLGVKRKVHP